eukprot:9622739-Alexandrium_andersonii.AAC.1
MSASLVGSEMCIRDRDSNHQSRTDSGDLCQHAHAPLELLVERLVVVLLPVSYTHLTLPTICSV